MKVEGNGQRIQRDLVPRPLIGGVYEDSKRISNNLRGVRPGIGTPYLIQTFMTLSYIPGHSHFA